MTPMQDRGLPPLIKDFPLVSSFPACGGDYQKVTKGQERSCLPVLKRYWGDCPEERKA